MSGIGTLAQYGVGLSLAVLLGSCTTTEQLHVRPGSLQQELSKPSARLLSQADKYPTLGLPLHGNFRFAVPKDAQSFDEVAAVPGPNGGYIDRFGNEWVLTPIGKNVFWKQILSEDGKFRLSGLLSPEEKQRGYIFVRRFDGGKVAIRG